MNFTDSAFIMICTIFVFFMTPGLAIFYGGLVRRKNVIGIMEQCYISIAIVSILWGVIGFSLAFGDSIGGVVGNCSYIFMRNIGVEGHPTIASNIPFILFFVFQLAFAIITPALISGAIAERINFKAYCIFIGCWILIVYGPVTHWVWGGGFLAHIGIADFAGGLVIHLSAGASALAAVLYVGERVRKDYTPCNMAYVTIGAGILWAGWFAFNSGSALAANTMASLAVANTMMASASAMVTWLLCSYCVSGRIKLLDSLMGGLAGLVVITPMAGFISPQFSIPVGLIGGVACYMAVVLRNRIGFDDTLDVWSLHGVGGASGILICGFLADPKLSQTTGAIYGNINQIVVQLTGIVCVGLYSVTATLVILKCINCFVPFRMSNKDEHIGYDISTHDEYLYYDK